MAVGTTMLILAGISAATATTSAVVSAKASSKAAKAQETGAERAARAVSDTYATQQRLMDPYAALGRQSANTLGRLMQPGVPYTPGMQQADYRAFQAAPQQWRDPTMNTLGNLATPRAGVPMRPFMPFAEPAPMPTEKVPAFPPPPPRVQPRRRLGALMPRRAA